MSKAKDPDSHRSALTYEDAGVNIDAGADVVARIKDMARETFTPETLSDVGSFGALYDAGFPGVSRPTLVSSADGVGTKLKLAFLAGIHGTVGEDLVNHCVNDILVQGARPLFFLDYFATGKLAPEVAAETISGIANGCLKTGTAFIGGETAEMPDFYRPGEYDLAGFIVGVVARDELIDGGAIMAGDRLLGLSSSGLHTNGYSLARRAIFDSAGRKHDEHIPELESTISEALLEIHTCYLGAISEVQSLSGRGWATGMAHITGGGIAGNLSRIIPDGLQAQVSRSSWKTPAVFEFIKQCGKLDEAEMYRAFNMGIGYIVVCRPDRFDEINRIILRHGHQTFELGEVVTAKVVTAPKVTLH